MLQKNPEFSLLLDLQAARALITDPAHWCRGAWARDAKGVEVNPTKGVSFCMAGAVLRVAAERHLDAFEALSRVVFSPGFSIGCINIAYFNDHTSHAQVLAVFDRAIEQEEARVTS